MIEMLTAPPWWTWIVAVFTSAFLVNGVPHFVHGVSGKRFPTPFSGGAGTLDGPQRNVFWGGGNLIVGGLLLWTLRGSLGDPLVIAELAIAAILLGAWLGGKLSAPHKVSGEPSVD
jgi:hypothetical protein